MGFYDLTKAERDNVVMQIKNNLLSDLESNIQTHHLHYFSDEDTYIRKTAYLELGKIYKQGNFCEAILRQLQSLKDHPDFKVRQTVINTAGEIGKFDFATVAPFFDEGLSDPHHAPRNAVIGSIKKMGEVNPNPILAWTKKNLHHPDQEIRREICHGLELRGRKHPEDILPLLMELQWDTTTRVRKTLIHVLGQIAYKKGCLEKVITHLNQWENTSLVAESLVEILTIHDRYQKFSFYTPEQALQYILAHSAHHSSMSIEKEKRES